MTKCLKYLYSHSNRRSLLGLAEIHEYQGEGAILSRNLQCHANLKIDTSYWFQSTLVQIRTAESHEKTKRSQRESGPGLRSGQWQGGVGARRFSLAGIQTCIHLITVTGVVQQFVNILSENFCSIFFGCERFWMQLRLIEISKMHRFLDLERCPSDSTSSLNTNNVNFSSRSRPYQPEAFGPSGMGLGFGPKILFVSSFNFASTPSPFISLRK